VSVRTLVIPFYYGSGSGSDFLARYGSGSSSRKLRFQRFRIHNAASQRQGLCPTAALFVQSRLPRQSTLRNI
jgi:hypothetical protein